jgi:hypothetical protein
MQTNAPIRRLLRLHGMCVPPRIYENPNVFTLSAILKNKGWEVVYLESPRLCLDPPPDVLGKIFPDIQPHELKEWINTQTRSDGQKE